ncbi:DUF3144 domain-containing protein [Hellea balneolensis]|uniref:DUF3144 domain-containing protein n=1 Tax=Hellea balneolensis TaxID=287478 RepID=UPI00040C533C|nr:DUF3144 domain-containing protein [Hellea balneolensis]
MSDLDDQFYDRADAHINLSNKQINEGITRGKVSASFMYSVARFNAWVSATGFENGQDMSSAKDETIEYFCEQYKKMLIENLDDYIKNFDTYFKKE